MKPPAARRGLERPRRVAVVEDAERRVGAIAPYGEHELSIGRRCERRIHTTNQSIDGVERFAVTASQVIPNERLCENSRSKDAGPLQRKDLGPLCDATDLGPLFATRGISSERILKNALWLPPQFWSVVEEAPADLREVSHSLAQRGICFIAW
jgi:hypothetical protein